MSLFAIVLIEIAIFILIGNWIGIFNTLLFIILTSIIGITIAKKLGMHSIRNVQNSINRGEAPGPAMVDTFMIFIGSILLALPGFLTDFIGFTFVLSFTRKIYKPFIYQWLRKKIENGQFIIMK